MKLTKLLQKRPLKTIIFVFFLVFLADFIFILVDYKQNSLEISLSAFFDEIIVLSILFLVILLNMKNGIKDSNEELIDDFETQKDEEFIKEKQFTSKSFNKKTSPKMNDKISFYFLMLLLIPPVILLIIASYELFRVS